MYYDAYVIGKENIASNTWAVVLLIEEDAISVVPQKNICVKEECNNIKYQVLWDDGQHYDIDVLFKG